MEHEPDDERPLLRSTRLPPAATTELRPSDEHGTRTRELRDALEELKADLDGRAAPGGPAPTSGPRAASTAPTPQPVASSAGTPSRNTSTRSGARPGRRLALGAAAAVAMLAAATGVVRVVAWSMEGPRDATGATPSASAWRAKPSSPSASRPPAPAPTAAAGGSAPSTGTSLPGARPELVLPPGFPRSGPGADAPGAELTAVVERGGTLLVHERLVVRAGTRSVQLAPAPARALPQALQGVGFAVRDLLISVDGRAVSAPGTSLGWRVTRADGAPMTQLVLRYRLAAAVVRATPAPPGRGTLVLRPITGAEASRAQDPVVVRLHDRRVGQVYCPSGPQPLCDTARGSAHVATVPPGAPPIVLAQVTLP